MNQADAHALAEFVHDHDKRFQAAPQHDADRWTLLLTQVSDGTPLPPIGSWEEYQILCLDAADPGPTVRAAWEQWRQRHLSPVSKD